MSENNIVKLIGFVFGAGLILVAWLLSNASSNENLAEERSGIYENFDSSGPTGEPLPFIIGINQIFGNTFVISGPSMEPTFYNGDSLVIDRRSSYIKNIGRGDFVVFKWPQNIAITFVKRVIGLPGELVEVKGGNVWIDGNRISEPYLSGSGTPTDTRRQLGDDEFFVMGDNRHNSSDSRIWGPVARNLIVGRVYK